MAGAGRGAPKTDVNGAELGFQTAAIGAGILARRLRMPAGKIRPFATICSSPCERPETPLFLQAQVLLMLDFSALR